MSGRSGLFALIAAVLCVLVAGNELAVENLLLDRDAGRIVGNAVGLVQWNFYDLGGDFRLGAIVGVVTFVLVTAVLGAIAGGARKPAALVGGWGAAVGAAMASGLARYLVIAPGGITEEEASFTIGAAAVGALPFAWLIAIAVALGARTGSRASTGGGTAPPPPGPTSSGPSPTPATWPAPDQAGSTAQPGWQPPPTGGAPAQPGWQPPGPTDPTTVQQPAGSLVADQDPQQAAPTAPTATPSDPTQVQQPTSDAPPGQGSSGGSGFTIGPPPDRRS